MFTDSQIQEWAKANSHIPTQEIEQDIADTERDIAEMEAEAKHLEETPLHMREARWNYMPADSRRSTIKEAENFIEKLKAILEYRNESTS